MKKIFFLTALAVMVLASCNRNEEVMSGDSGEKATLTISIQSPETYAALTTAPTDVINNYTVFVTNQNDEIAWSRYSSTNADMTGLPVSTQAKQVYVVANGGNLTSIATMAALNTKTIDLNGTDAAGKQKDTRWATGVSAPLTFTQSGTDFKATTTVAVTFVAARIKVTIKTDGAMAANYNSSASDGSLVLGRVAVLNARGESKLFGTSLIPATYTNYKKYYEGMANNSFDYYPSGTDVTYDADTQALLSDAVGGYDNGQKKFTNTFYYYVFENNATAASAFPTIVLIQGTYDSKPIYFPVHLAAYETSVVTSGITRGNSYDIEITLKGDPRKTVGGDYPGDTGGTDDPTVPVINAAVDVEVTLNNWVAKNISKTFE
jgi:hypothetical protein